MKYIPNHRFEGETIRLIGRGSWLSLLQLEKVKQKIIEVYPDVKVEIILRVSRGDTLQNIPLQTVEGSDFFTQEIFAALQQGEADIAVHSLKDMSSEHFFGTNQFGVVDRDDVRDIAIFRKEVEQKLKNGENIIIGTCSPRREEMAIGFLQKALPQWNASFRVETKIIRGNIDTRLRKLDEGEYDGIILATAGLNRLLSATPSIENPDEGAQTVKKLLKDKQLMLLPLIECVPAPCQGAIVAEANPLNKKAVEVLNAINDKNLLKACVKEKQIALQYGAGCLQRFGVTHISYVNSSADTIGIVYAAGKDSRNNPFSKWIGLPALDVANKIFFSTTDFMGSFFQYRYYGEDTSINEAIVYIANYKAAESETVANQLQSKQVWAAGTKTWLELSKKGIWVIGSADAFGLEFLLGPWQMPLFAISKEQVAVITNNSSAAIWQAKGWKVYGTYDTLEKQVSEIEEQIKAADIIFWTSFRQYAQYKMVLKDIVQHICTYGETTEQFKAAGINPVVFPNIKAFQQWRQTSTPLTSEG
ncbi:MAG: hydroxymethylbilane synthase [Bacteroidota bacterium]|nr:hydroxymethylbilane synthase [Bacteroidota bacterium]